MKKHSGVSDPLSSAGTYIHVHCLRVQDVYMGVGGVDYSLYIINVYIICFDDLVLVYTRNLNKL